MSCVNITLLANSVTQLPEAPELLLVGRQLWIPFTRVRYYSATHSGLVVIDLASSYPTRKGIAPYAISHVGMVSVTALGLHTTRA